MKSVIRVCDLSTSNDVKNIREAVASNEGVVACEINLSKKEVSVVFDSYSVRLEEILNSIEDLGYTII